MVPPPFVGPLIFVCSPLPGRNNEVDRYYYAPRADITIGEYAAFLSFCTHYGYPLAILHCPNLAEYQARNPSILVEPFSNIQSSFIQRGRALLAQTQIDFEGEYSQCEDWCGSDFCKKCCGSTEAKRNRHR